MVRQHMWRWTKRASPVGAAGGEAEDTWTWYVWLGFVQRGDPSSLWLKPMPLRTSRGEPRIPQLKTDEYLDALSDAKFCEATNAILFSDSAPAFVNTTHPGIHQKFHVNHSEREWTRSVEVLYRGAPRAALAHTQTIDRAWRSVKDEIPDCQTARTPVKQSLLDIYVRYHQWQYMHAGKDRWIEFCKAVERFRAYLRSFDDEDADDLAPAVAEAASVLGEKDPTVPDEVHERMCALALQGIIPKTSLPQRQRSKKCIGSQYAVPQFLSEARDYNYISPNLEAPTGFRWAPKGNSTWVLEARGG